jgi:hypothetical protein
MRASAHSEINLRPWLLIAALLLSMLLSGCARAPTRARRIMAPVAKTAEKAGRIAGEQSVTIRRQKESVARLRTGIVEARETAERMDRTRPDADTALLLMKLRVAEREGDVLNETVGTLTRQNERLVLTIEGMKTSIATAQDKVAVTVANADSWQKWAWRWFGAFTALALGIVALFTFKAWLLTLPVIGPVLARLF